MTTRHLLAVTAVALALATACGGGRDVGSSASPPTTLVPTTLVPTTTSSAGSELDAETARRRNLTSIGPDLADVAMADGVPGQPVTPFDLVATDADSPCPTLRFSADGLPDGLVVTDAGDCTARVSGTVGAPAGRYQVTYRVTDDTGASDVSVAVIEVRA